MTDHPHSPPPPPPTGLGPRLRVAHLDGRGATPFDVAPDAAQRAALAEWLDILAIDALNFTGQIVAAGSSDWVLTGRLSAQVVQSCVVTLAPVRTPLDEEVRRRFTPHAIDPEGDEIEMPEDDTLEPLGSHIDLGAVMIEALELALPLYPRVADAALDAPGDEAPVADTRKPFANLADLLGKKNQ